MNDEEYADFRDCVKEMVAQMGTELDPDEDWQPVLFMLKGTELQVVGIDPRLLNIKPIMTHVMADIVHDVAPDACGFVATSWMVKGSDQEEMDKVNELIDSGEGLGNHPERTECVTLSFYTPTLNEHFSATIVRCTDSHPTLEEWEGWPGEQAQGLFVEPMKLAMQARLN